MVAEVFSAMIQGIEGQIVKIQVDISNGLPNFNMIGYLSNEVKESKERVRTALNNIGVLLPPKRISVNFAPADFRKCGTSFDIGVAAAILLAMDFVPETYIKDTLFVGELSLNGQICPISGVLPIVVAASKRGIKRCIVAQENVAEAAFVEQMEVVGCRNLEELFFYLKHGYIINDDSGEILENSGNICNLWKISSSHPSENIWKAPSKTADEIHSRFQSNDGSRKIRMSNGYSNVGIAVIEKNGNTYIAEIYLS